MTPANIAMMIVIPAVLLGALAFVLSSGRMSRPLRRRVELFLMAILFPAFLAFWGWQVLEAAQAGHKPLLITLLVVTIAAVAWSGVSTFRKWRRAD
ncbi:hypothetical protein [Brevundimonas goettingensis]|jgi:hypothetical protein|uniref:Uncharacterized protein n=1 Tax=Brevundimonas goettingensis TaxID=2774190 RepID=A0A975C546_9CAUL|nr:hypothetical protein [Brevundimonas goettingensis]QTC93047.1 hypothetical protein IFJ75_09485 [Brevundimonas goettingensis]